MRALTHRLPREFKNNIATYLALYVLAALVISFSVGSLIAAGSMLSTVNDDHVDANVEDFEIICDFEPTDKALEALDDIKPKVELIPNFTIDAPLYIHDFDEQMNVRLFNGDTKVDIPTIVEGSAPAADNEIALAPTFCATNDIHIGDVVRVGDTSLIVSGLAVLPQYAVALEDSSDFMFNNITFSLAIVTPSTFDSFENYGISYVYAGKILDADPTCTEEYSDNRVAPLPYVDRIVVERDVVDSLLDNETMINAMFDLDDLNSANFANNDIRSDLNSMLAISIILLLVIAFVFDILNRAIIERQTSAIGTLLASGYRRGELVRHYLVIPAVIAVLAGITGVFFGTYKMSTWITEEYYRSYNLPVLQLSFDSPLTIGSVALPVCILILIAFVGIRRSLQADPLSLLYHKGRKNKSKAPLKLPEKWPFKTRMQLRILIQNKGQILILFFGVFASLNLFLWGLGMTPMMSNYCEKLAQSLPADHVYFLKAPLKIDPTEEEKENWINLEDILNDQDFELTLDNRDKFMGAVDALSYSLPINTEENSPNVIDQSEQFAVFEFGVPRKFSDSLEQVNVYGIQPSSKYFDADVSGDNVIIGGGLAHKCGLGVDKEFSLTDRTTGIVYSLTPNKVNDNITDMNVYMSKEKFVDMFAEKIESQVDWINSSFQRGIDSFGMPVQRDDLTISQYYNGIVSNDPLALNADYEGKELTPSLTLKAADQMEESMQVITKFTVCVTLPMAFLIIFLITKTILERSTVNISRLKIVGYRDKELYRLYIRPLTIAMLVSVAISVPLLHKMLAYLIDFALASFAGNIPIPTDPMLIFKSVSMCLACYVLVVIIHRIKLKRVSELEALASYE